MPGSRRRRAPRREPRLSRRGAATDDAVAPGRQADAVPGIRHRSPGFSRAYRPGGAAGRNGAGEGCRSPFRRGPPRVRNADGAPRTTDHGPWTMDHDGTSNCRGGTSNCRGGAYRTAVAVRPVAEGEPVRTPTAPPRSPVPVGAVPAGASRPYRRGRHLTAPRLLPVPSPPVPTRRCRRCKALSEGDRISAHGALPVPSGRYGPPRPGGSSSVRVGGAPSRGVHAAGVCSSGLLLRSSHCRYGVARSAASR